MSQVSDSLPPMPVMKRTGPIGRTGRKTISKADADAHDKAMSAWLAALTPEQRAIREAPKPAFVPVPNPFAKAPKDTRTDHERLRMIPQGEFVDAELVARYQQLARKHGIPDHGDAFVAFATATHARLAKKVLAQQDYATKNATPAPNAKPKSNGKWRQDAPSVLSSVTVFKTADKFTPLSVEWLVKDWMPLDAVTMAMGRTKIGKSQFAIWVIACITNGRPVFPGGAGSKPADVILISGEDDAQRAIIPRLMAAGADLSRVHIVSGYTVQLSDGDFEERRFCLADALLALADVLAKVPGVKLIVVDPINSFLGSKVDTHRNAETRTVLQPLKDLAEAHKLAVLLIHHMKKGNKGDNDVTDMSGGSNAFVEFARSIIALAREKKDSDRFIVQLVAANYAKAGERFLYTVEPTIVGPGIPAHYFKIVEGEKPSRSISEAMAGDGEDDAGALAHAKQFLAAELEDGEAHLSTEIQAAAKAENITVETLRRAREALGVVCKKGKGKGSKWTWQLAPSVAAEGWFKASVERGANALRG